LFRRSHHVTRNHNLAPTLTHTQTRTDTDTLDMATWTYQISIAVQMHEGRAIERVPSMRALPL